MIDEINVENQISDVSHISIIGSCVPRDVFEICKEADDYKSGEENEYAVDRFIQSIAPISAVSEPLDEKIAEKLIEESTKSETSGFYKRNFLLDVTKGWSEYLSQVKSDWLIVDFSTARFKIIEFENTFLTKSLETSITDKLDNIKEDSLLFKLKSSRTFDASECECEYLINCYFKYFDKLLSLYPQERIIVLGMEHGFSFVDYELSRIATLNHCAKTRQKIENKIMDLAYACAKEYMPKAHFIEALPVNVCDVNHKWGILGLHFTPDTYLYYFRCIDYIVHSEGDRQSEAEYIRRMQIEFSKKIFDKFSAFVNKDIETERNVLKLSEGILPGVYEKNGIKLVVSDDCSYSVTGTATDDVTLYLLSSHKNPIGDWASIKATIGPGVYRFMTGTRKIGEDVVVQLVLANSPEDRKWLYGYVGPYQFTLDKQYNYLLVRMSVKSGVTVDEKGKLFLEKIE